jgi:hypothetical protein
MKVSKKQQAAWDKKNMDRSNGHSANNLEAEGYVRDRKTGEYYNPQEAFDAMMNKPEILAVFKRLAVR